MKNSKFITFVTEDHHQTIS